MKADAKKKEPLIHITRRKDVSLLRSIVIRAAAIVLALIVCALVTTFLTGENPIDVFGTILSGAFGTPRKMWVLGQEMAILLCVSLALAPAFKMKFWNLGGEGQILMGGLAAAACMILLGGKVESGAMPQWLLILIMVVASIGAGALWAFIPAFFKAKWGTNETLFTLMMNYVATQLVAYFVILWEVPKGAGKIGIINQSSEAGWLPVIGDYKYLLNIIVVLVLTVGMYVYLKYSKQGYELSVVGESERTANYVGINVKKVIIRTMLISGAICGVAGLLLVGGTDHTVTTTISAGRGFTAVMVAWLAKFNPLGMIFTTFLLVLLSRGANEISTVFSLNKSFGDILTGIILFFIIGSEFFINYQIHFRKSHKPEAAAAVPAEDPHKEALEQILRDAETAAQSVSKEETK